MDHKKFFEDYGDYLVKVQFYGIDHYIEVKDLYQAFKRRLIEELRAEVRLPNHITNYAKLIDTTGQADEG